MAAEQPDMQLLAQSLLEAGNQPQHLPNYPIFNFQNHMEQILQRLDQIQEQLNQFRDEYGFNQRMLPIRQHNASLSPTAEIKYPIPIDHIARRPINKLGLSSLSSIDCQATAMAFHLPPLAGAYVAVKMHRQQISEYLGCAMAF